MNSQTTRCRKLIRVFVLFTGFFLLGCSTENSGDNDLSSNNPPVADVGTDEDVKTGDTVTLDGSNSSDTDGSPLIYSWSTISKPIGSGASLSNTTEVFPKFVSDIDETYEIRLTVNDGLIDSDAARVTVTASTGIPNNPPVANAGTDQISNIYTASTVILNGSASSDQDGDLLSYSWSIITRPVGSTLTLSNPSTSSPILIPDRPGIYEISLVVNDGIVNSTADTVLVDVSRII